MCVYFIFSWWFWCNIAIHLRTATAPTKTINLKVAKQKTRERKRKNEEKMFDRTKIEWSTYIVYGIMNIDIKSNRLLRMEKCGEKKQNINKRSGQRKSEKRKEKGKKQIGYILYHWVWTTHISTCYHCGRVSNETAYITLNQTKPNQRKKKFVIEQLRYSALSFCFALYFLWKSTERRRKNTKIHQKALISSILQSIYLITWHFSLEPTLDRWIFHNPPHLNA